MVVFLLFNNNGDNDADALLIIVIILWVYDALRCFFSSMLLLMLI